ncbi:uncharacterized protein FIESC28_06215 [Fusarium coffeatum]|uniref:Phosphatidylinositol-specific phospholipase C X domain-containing protein n=1 Tax=Fusarium coffeatum TaxID=231269 RepID=A0A366RLY9_9HYPO|nr:uncharacterized protein FIESC28_06215 [Fusarium coffeatum]RBR18149.1 hypothetical protein FIESC28_06215 [Fusarium coffeatum]
MGEGGYMILTNGTPYRWKRSDQMSYQMKSWDFPEVIEAGKVPRTYIEFSQGAFKKRSDTSGSVKYTLEGTGCSFTIHVRDDDERIWVKLDSLESVGNARGSEIHLGWRHDKCLTWVLSGSKEEFHTSNPPMDWMQQCRKTIGHLPLSKICLLGTHDSGMSTTSHSLVPVSVIDPYVLCQCEDIYGQLQKGARYFDIRPQIYKGKWCTGHYTGKVGARGENIADIIDGVNKFTKDNGELIIINFSHSLQSDVEEWREFNKEEWHNLMKELQKLNNLFIMNDKSKANNLSNVKVDEFIGNGKAAVVCVIEDWGSLSLGDYLNQGFFKSGQLNIRNEYANKDETDVMVADQIEKMKHHMSSNDKRMFLLSWTLTQQVPEWDGSVRGFAGSVTDTLRPIKLLAKDCNPELFTRLLPEVSESSFPNVVYIDYLDSMEYVALVVAINDKVFNN